MVLRPSGFLQLAGADTVVARIVMPEPSWFEQMTNVASGILTLLPFVLFIVLTIAVLRMRTAFEHAKASLEDVRTDLRELIGAANRIGDDLAGISTSVRTTVDAVSDTVEYTNTRAHRAVSQLADRVDAFNDSLEMVQADTQKIIVTAIAALRGVRAGVTAMRKPPKRKPRRRELVDDDTPPDLPARPRLRRRARGGD